VVDKAARRVISGVTLDLDVDDIRQETNCKMAIRLHRQEKGKRTPTYSILLIFEDNVLPDHVTIGFTRYHVREYVPTATRCMKCQGFNHVAKSCRRKETCPKCAGGHSFEACPNKDSPKCANCQGPNSSAYKGCPKFKAATQVVQIASKQGISYAAAVKKQKMSVAVKQMIRSSVTVSAVQPKLSRTIETQTEDPAQISPKARTVQSRTIETQTEDEEVSRETQTEPAAASSPAPTGTVPNAQTVRDCTARPKKGAPSSRPQLK